MFCEDLNESIGCYKEQIVNSEQCSELDATSAAMVFSNDRVVTIMDTSCTCMMDNTFKLQETIKQPTVSNHDLGSVPYYFSSTFEVSSYIWPLI